DARRPLAVGADWSHEPDAFDEARRQFDAYFAGTLQQFNLSLDALGTPFQRSIWNELARIPYAQTISYGELARRIGKPNASRAVGLANGANPLSIIVPCHRVIGTNGSLTGYGGGLAAKQWLLAHERRHAGRTPLPAGA
ncbi:MAG: methylated-DNA--[protein]-cysteine S-methyltransferase, partial [Dokdonella sp.]